MFMLFTCEQTSAHCIWCYYRNCYIFSLTNVKFKLLSRLNVFLTILHICAGEQCHHNKNIYRFDFVICAINNFSIQKKNATCVNFMVQEIFYLSSKCNKLLLFLFCFVFLDANEHQEQKGFSIKCVWLSSNMSWYELRLPGSNCETVSICLTNQFQHVLIKWTTF